MRFRISPNGPYIPEHRVLGLRRQPSRHPPPRPPRVREHRANDLRVALDAARQQERDKDLEQHQRHERTADDADQDPHWRGR
jgi:hypothetical protein